ncbi:polysaccharide deacetylase family protein [Salinarchaeum sp. IM2453]|uniref:polysaccharide deacetylase family protein n=1 Tax=Salinarchaeum sp. IM2453 TaxID=2862870 RepID=UPI001C83C2FC|nr:polysaccharide deacetylase family protein [Salinarchaeum sp. IM2453]QZA89094.1 polysaccharide deacetylase family protein [Salinarchaeum sp. IM2453]
MYHYVRDLSRSRYPEINALTIDEFKYQLDHLAAEYSFITVDELQSALYHGTDLPNNPVLLTFDDGFIDHYHTVYPILKQRGIQGAFFPSAEPIENDIVLDVHKIHTILAQRETDKQLVDDVFDCLEHYQPQFDLDTPEQYYTELAEEGRWDPKEIVFVKRLLQHVLPEKPRELVVDDLFDQYVDVDEQTLSQEWYMTKNQLRVMANNGMHIGSHTANHYWLDTLSLQDAVHEIEQSLSFLEDINGTTDDWTMCYPYGGYDDTTLELLEEYDCNLGFTTSPRRADTETDSPLELPRLDTNDLPQA